MCLSLGASLAGGNEIPLSQLKTKEGLYILISLIVSLQYIVYSLTFHHFNLSCFYKLDQTLFLFGPYSFLIESVSQSIGIATTVYI